MTGFPTHPAALALLSVPERAYRGAVALRNRWYDGRARRAPVPVISVGNLAVGGTGKTPVVAWIVRHLLAIPVRPAVVSRGYGGIAGRGPLVVSEGDGPLATAARAGDEPWMLARTVPGAMVVVGSDRVAGARRAAEGGADVVVLDDGFQHRRLARDLDLVLLDAAAPFGNGRMLPAGPLREPLSSLARAGAILLTRSASGEVPTALLHRLRELAPAAPVIPVGLRHRGFVDAGGRSADRPPRAVAFCGIAGPEGFWRALAEEGVEVLEFLRFPDHHRFTPAEIEDLRRRSRERRAPLVTTEKDLARLPGQDGLLALRVEAAPHDPGALAALLERVLEPGAA